MVAVALTVITHPVFRRTRPAILHGDGYFEDPLCSFGRDVRSVELVLMPRKLRKSTGRHSCAADRNQFNEACGRPPFTRHSLLRIICRWKWLHSYDGHTEQENFRLPELAGTKRRP